VKATEWPPVWKLEDIKHWLEHDIKLSKDQIDKLENGKDKILNYAEGFLRMTQSDIHRHLGDEAWNFSKTLFFEIDLLRKSLVWPKSFPPTDWKPAQIRNWLREDCALPKEYTDKLEKEGCFNDPVKFLNLSETDLENYGLPWNEAQSLNLFARNLWKHVSGNDKAKDTLTFVPSCPYLWPFNGKLNRFNTAIIIIDMQEDFVGPQGYFAKMGYLDSLKIVQQTTQNIKGLLQVVRAKGIHVIHTREGHRDNLVDLPENKRWRSEKMHAGIGSLSGGNRILTRGFSGWDIISELKPLPDEVVIDKPGKGTFVATDIEFILKLRKIENVIFTGVTTDVCVHTTMREANDRGFECLLAEDGTAAAFDKMRLSSIESIRLSGGIFGATASCAEIIKVLNHLPDKQK